MCSYADSVSLTQSDYVTILSAAIAVAGVIIGVVLTFCTQLILDRIQKKRELKKMIYEKQMDIYPKALQYIMLYAKLQNRINLHDTSDEVLQMMEQEKSEFENFYFIFSLITQQSKLKQFNDLRDRIQKENLTPSVAYENLQELLSFNEK